MRADPEPDNIAVVLHREGSVVETYANRPEAANLLEMERRMVRIFPQDSVALISQPDGRLPATSDSNAKTAGWRDVSPIRAAARSQILDRFICQRVQPALGDVPFHLLVPIGSIEFRKPGAKGCQFCGRKFEYGFFDFLDAAHDNSVLRYRARGQPTGELCNDRCLLFNHRFRTAHRKTPQFFNKAATRSYATV